MAISATLGGTASNGSATTTLAFSAASITGGQDIVVAVALADTTKTVTGIADTAGNTFVLRSAINGTGVRSEIWEAQSVLGNASDVITVTFSGATLASAVFEEYAGVLSQSYVTDLVPHDMTSWTSHSPYVASADAEYDSSIYPAWKCFDGGTNRWAHTVPGGVGWIKLDLGASNAQIVYSYALRAASSTAENPRDWTFEGSNNNSTWTTLDTVTGQTGWSSGEIRTYACDVTTTAYRYFRVNITATNNGTSFGPSIDELFFYGAPGTLSAQNTSTNTGNSISPQTALTLQEQGNWPAAAVGFVCNSGDTVASSSGTIRQSVVPALTSVGIALVDFAGGTNAGVVTLTARLSTSRNWAVAGVNLRNGGSALLNVGTIVISTPNANADAGANHQRVRGPQDISRGIVNMGIINVQDFPLDFSAVAAGTAGTSGSSGTSGVGSGTGGSGTSGTSGTSGVGGTGGTGGSGTSGTSGTSGPLPAYISSLIAGPDTTKTITGATHGYATAGLLVQVYDNATPRNPVDATWTVDPSTFDVVVSFAEAQSNYYVTINGASGQRGPQGIAGAGSPSYISSLIVGPDSTKTITGAMHGYLTAGLLVAVYDNATPRNAIEASWTVNQTTYDVVVAFGTPQSNYYVVINGASGVAGPPVQHSFGAAFSGGGVTLTAGLTFYATVAVGGTITAWNILVDAGTCTIKVWKVARGTAIPTAGNSINTSGLSISTGTAIHSTTLTDFTTLVVATGDVVGIHLETCSGPSQINFSVEL